VDLLIIGNGMFGAAIARHLAPQATVTLVGPAARADGSDAYGAHHDAGRIIGDVGRDLVWSELNRRARDGMTELDPTLITQCGALTATTRGGPDYLSVADEIQVKHSWVTAVGGRPGLPVSRQEGRVLRGRRDGRGGCRHCGCAMTI
jgi:hypothetical protein